MSPAAPACVRDTPEFLLPAAGGRGNVPAMPNGMNAQGGARAAAGPEFDAVVVGAGFAGLYMLHRLRGLGLSARVLEAGDGVGGTWYWNRYPGARCDIESMAYSYSLLRRAAAGVDSGASATRRSRRSCATSSTSPTASTCGATSSSRRASPQRASTRRAAAGTIAHRPRRRRCRRGSASWRRAASPPRSVPDIPGLERFAGERTTPALAARGVDFTGKRVGVIGTGSSAIQAIPVIAAQAAHLTVFQRTPNFSVPARNGPLDARARARVKAQLRRVPPPGAAGAQRGGFARRPERASPRSRRRRRSGSAEFEARWQRGRLLPFIGGVHRPARRTSEANDTAAEFVRSKIRETRARPGVAELLCPNDYPVRHQAAVRRHRLLRDVQPRQRDARRSCSETPIERDHRRPACASRDARVRARQPRVRHGFDAMTGALLAIDIRGRGGHVAAREVGGRVRAPTSGCRSPASRTCSRSPGRAARRC